MTDFKIIGLDDSVNKAVLITPWSIIHFLLGYLCMVYVNYFNINKDNAIVALFILHTIYEIKDYYFSYIKDPQSKYEKWSSNNSIYNCFGDTIAFMLGVAFAVNTNYSTTTLIIATLLFLLSVYLFHNNFEKN